MRSFLPAADTIWAAISPVLLGSFLIRGRDSFVGNFPDLIQIFKQIGIQDFMSIRSVEPFDQGDLAGFAGFDVARLDAFVFAPLGQDCQP